MEIAILIEPLAGGRFRALAAAPFDISAEAATSEEATCELTRKINDHLAGGAKLSKISIAAGPPSWLGAAEDDASWNDFEASITENRHADEQTS